MAEAKQKEPYLDGKTLHFKGETYDLSEYSGQQHYERNGVLIYELTRAGGGGKFLQVDSINEAHEVESVCNLFYRGW